MSDPASVEAGVWLSGARLRPQSLVINSAVATHEQSQPGSCHVGTPALHSVRAEGPEVFPVAEAEDRKRAQALRRRVPAYALIRAMVTQDQDAAVLLVDQARTAGSLDLLTFNMASVAAQALLASEGYDLEKVLAALDFWMESAANGVPSAARARDAAV